MEKDKGASVTLYFRRLKHAILLMVIMLLVVSETILFNMSLQPNFSTGSPTSEVLQVIRTEKETLALAKNKMERKSLEPPKNSTSSERIAWLCSNLQEFELFKSSNRSTQFHQRVLNSLGEKCEVRFFMTWFSPAEFFGEREFLAVESVFKSHPKGCLMIASESMDSKQGNSILKPLLDLGYKVYAATPDISSLLKNTPAESWFREMRSCKRDPGIIPLSQNLSNLVRLAILYKYGGVYLDTDFIVTRSFKRLKNSIGAQEVGSKKWKMLNNAVLIFDKNHPLLYRFIEEFASSFDGNKWGRNGPYLVTRVVQRVEETIGKRFKVLPRVAFYRFNWIDIRRLFQTPRSSNDSKLLKDDLVKLKRESYGLHLWNKNTGKLKIGKGSVIDVIVSEQCVVCKRKSDMKM